MAFSEYSCPNCRNFIAGQFCFAFLPGRIPFDILDGTNRHTEPVDGDHGMIYEPIDAEPQPSKSRWVQPKEFREEEHPRDHGKFAPKEGGESTDADKLTETQEFKDWFKGSKIVDAKGKPLVVFHGTPKTFTEFSDSALGRNTGHPGSIIGHCFIDNRGAAETYGRQQHVMECYLSLKNPIKVSEAAVDVGAVGNLSADPIKEQDNAAREIKEYYQKKGYDGLEYTDSDGHKNWVVFDPKNIKIAKEGFARKPKEKDFDESKHPRDDRGRFGSGTGAFTGKPANPDGKDTQEQYQNKDGTWTKERAAMHAKIIAKYFEGKTPVAKPVSYLMGGGPAVGKSSIIKAGFVSIPDNTVKVDVDEVMKMIPEYQDKKAAKDFGAAAFAHEEASYLAKIITEKAAKESYNVLFDGTGDTGIEKITNKIARLKTSGQPVVANYCTCPTEMSIKRSNDRATDPKSDDYGRKVPEAFIRKAHKLVSQIVPALIKAGTLDELHVWDTSVPMGEKPILIASAKGKDLKVFDQDRWATFLKKGDEK